jgi:hypothetical protein
MVFVVQNLLEFKEVVLNKILPPPINSTIMMLIIVCGKNGVKHHAYKLFLNVFKRDGN